MNTRLTNTVMVVDLLAENAGHPIDDDAYLAKCLSGCVHRFMLVSSETSVANATALHGVACQVRPKPRKMLRPKKLRLISAALAVSCDGWTDVFLQGVDEISAIAIMLKASRARFHFVVQHHLRPDRLQRHPILGYCVLAATFLLAKTIMVHSQFQVRRIQQLFPFVRRTKIVIVPFHMFSAKRERKPISHKTNDIILIGPLSTHRPIERFLSLIRADRKQKFRYKLCGMNQDIPDAVVRELSTQPNVEIRFGYMSADEYHQVFGEAIFVFMNHMRADYDGTLSGIFCDAVASGTAIIAEHMAILDEWFNKYGEMGILIDCSDETWPERVMAIDFRSRYAHWQGNMAACRSGHSQERIREVLLGLLARG